MTTFDKLEQLFRGEREEIALDEIRDIMSLIHQGEMRLSGTVVVDEDVELNIDFVKRGGNWYVTGYETKVTA